MGCTANNARLCTPQEITDRCTRGTGCNFNSRLVWTCIARGDGCASDAKCCSVLQIKVTIKFKRGNTLSLFIQLKVFVGDLEHWKHSYGIHSYNRMISWYSFSHLKDN